MGQFCSETYKRPYNFQQQDGCKGRGIEYITVPEPEFFDHEAIEIPEKVNGDEMGVSFETWLNRDPKQPIPNQTADYELELFWERNFYPDITMIINDLHNKGLLEEGDYIININW